MSATESERRAISYRIVAQRLGTSLAAVRGAVRAGQLPGMITAADIEDALSNQPAWLAPAQKRHGELPAIAPAPPRAAKRAAVALTPPSRGAGGRHRRAPSTSAAVVIAVTEAVCNLSMPRFDPDLKDIIRCIPGRWYDPESRSWSLSITPDRAWSVITLAEHVGARYVGSAHETLSTALARRDRSRAVLELVQPERDGQTCVSLCDDWSSPWRAQIEAAGRPIATPLIARSALPLTTALARTLIELDSSGGELALADTLRERAVELANMSEPALTLAVSYENDGLTAGWEWTYEDAGELRREPFAEPEWGNRRARNIDAERAVIRSAALLGSGLERFGLVERHGHPHGSARVRGVDAVVFTRDVLPALAVREDIELAVHGVAPDYRDVSESLSVCVAAAPVDGQRDWFDLNLSVCVEGRTLRFADVFRALAGGERTLMLDDGAYFTLDDPRFLKLSELIERARAIIEAPTPETTRVSRFDGDLFAEMQALGVVEEQAASWRDALAPLRSLQTIDPVAAPGGLRAQLRAYQHDGFSWLAALWKLGLGGILADDMGLGKTVQALALICHAREQDPGAPPFLVIAPTSVAANWVSEARRFAPALNVQRVASTLARERRCLQEIAADADVIVTTYALMRLDRARYRTLAWSGLLLDEAQAVKNYRGQTYRAAREIDARVKFAITGTPMENSLMELWAMLSITAPGLYPDPGRFKTYYARPIENDGQGAGELLAQLRRTITPLLKRRTKEHVESDLPAKQEQTLPIELGAKHRALYDVQLQRERAKVLALLDDPNGNRLSILASLTRLRLLSLHPALVDDAHRDVPCAKLDRLADDLHDIIAGGHRALVFSQFTRFLTFVRERLDAERIPYSYLDGKTKRREAVIERFRGGEAPVFVISLKAGGVGLNLTEADYCFLLDPWWNPAAEAQAIDRTHRIGQTRPVFVSRLVAAASIEEKVRELAQRKAQLFHGVLDDGEPFARGLSAADIRALVS